MGAMRESKKARAVAQDSANAKLNLLADKTALNPLLSSLFDKKEPSVKAQAQRSNTALSEIDEDVIELDDAEVGDIISDDSAVEDPDSDTFHNDQPQSKRKRKRARRDDDEELEEAYAQRLAREEDRDAQRAGLEPTVKRQRSQSNETHSKRTPAKGESSGEVELDEGDAASDDEDEAQDPDAEDDSDVMSPPPRHETEVAADEELAKANRTVFLGNVSTSAISSKAARKTLLAHLASFFPKAPAPEKGGPKHAVESLRFRSTPYASAIPKKAAFAKKELMDATTKSTNAYAVYTSQALARSAAKHLNGSVVLDRHLRVDEVAHPAKVDHTRCIFVGNLGFVDDESNIQRANEEDGREKRKPGKEPADVEEGLWRTFGKCGTVESVRVIRDGVTRVGKGIAYVQFTDENAVEAALLYNEKKFPPMLPRKLRVSRAKAQKRNAKPGSGRPMQQLRSGGLPLKMSAEEASRLGRAGKLLGRAGAAQLKRSEGSRPVPRDRSSTVIPGTAIRKPEQFVFEGHRASSKQGKTGLKLGGRHAKKANVTKRSASFKAKKKAAA